MSNKNNVVEMNADTVAGFRVGVLRNMLRDTLKSNTTVDIVITSKGKYYSGRLNKVDFERVCIVTSEGAHEIPVEDITGVHSQYTFFDELACYAVTVLRMSDELEAFNRAFEAYNCGKLSILDITLNKRVSGTVEKTHNKYTDEAIQWCRANAPDACKDCSDDELWDLLQGSYYAEHNSKKDNTISKDIDYKELLRDTPADIVTFSCPIDAGFLTSLEKDGYTEHLRTQSQSDVSKWMHKKEHAYGESAPTSSASWTIYEETRDCYYEINIANVGDKYEVEISRLNVTNIRLEMI